MHVEDCKLYGAPNMPECDSCLVEVLGNLSSQRFDHILHGIAAFHVNAVLEYLSASGKTPVGTSTSSGIGSNLDPATSA